MPLVLADRVLESSTTVGTGVFTLAGAVLGFRSFASAMSVSDTCWYYIEGVDSFGKPTGEYEYGLGTYSAANQLTRTTVRGSSNGGSAVNFTAGSKLVGVAMLSPTDVATKSEWLSSFGAINKAGDSMTGNLTTSGRIGIGTNYPDYPLVVSLGGANGLEVAPFLDSTILQSYDRATSAYTAMLFSAADYAWNADGAERMAMSGSGNLALGTAVISNVRFMIHGATSDNSAWNLYTENSSASQMFCVRNDGGMYLGMIGGSPYNQTTASAANAYISSDGYLYRSTSSIKYKRDVRDYPRGIDAVLALRPVLYKSKGKGDVSARLEKEKKLKEKNPAKELPQAEDYAGFIAEEVHDAGLTEFVQYGEDDKPDALHYAQMTALLVKAMQEQQALIVALQEAVNKLGNR